LTSEPSVDDTGELVEVLSVLDATGLSVEELLDDDDIFDATHMFVRAL
jgi:hypothetical protein